MDASLLAQRKWLNALKGLALQIAIQSPAEPASLSLSKKAPVASKIRCK